MQRARKRRSWQMLFAAHRRAAAVDQGREELQRALLRFSDAGAARAHPRQQARGAVLALIPVVHAREHFIGLMDGEHRAIGDEIQLPSVTTVAISMIESVSGFRPVISRSIQTR